MSGLIRFDEDKQILRGQMGEPIPAGGVIELLVQCLQHLSHSEAELYMIASTYYSTCGINWQTTDYHELSIDSEGYADAMTFLKNNPLIPRILADFKKDRGE